MKSMLGGVALAFLSMIAGCARSGGDPSWVHAFGYAPSDVHSIEVGEFGFLYVPVRIDGERLMLPFDTGNMIGISISTGLFDGMGLTADETYDRLDSSGEIVATLRVARAADVSLLGREPTSMRVYELDHPSLPGLAGPTLLGGGHFTLDYGTRRMAFGAAGLPDSVPGFRKVPLVRSRRHPLLILVRGTIEGRTVLLELDTGKSRTVINPDLASDLALERVPRGVAIGSLRIADLALEVPSAKEVDQSAIDPDLPEPILAGVGSDLLSRFVWTVDYDAGVLWVPRSR